MTQAIPTPAEIRTMTRPQLLALYNQHAEQPRKAMHRTRTEAIEATLAVVEAKRPAPTDGTKVLKSGKLKVTLRDRTAEPSKDRRAKIAERARNAELGAQMSGKLKVKTPRMTDAQVDQYSKLAEQSKPVTIVAETAEIASAAYLAMKNLFYQTVGATGSRGPHFPAGKWRDRRINPNGTVTDKPFDFSDVPMATPHQIAGVTAPTPRAIPTPGKPTRSGRNAQGLINWQTGAFQGFPKQLNSKRALVMRLCSRPQGATYAELLDGCGWDWRTLKDGIRLIAVNLGWGFETTTDEDGVEHVRMRGTEENMSKLHAMLAG